MRQAQINNSKAGKMFHWPHSSSPFIITNLILLTLVSSQTFWKTTNNTLITCQKTTYTSSHTRCEIQFDYCNATQFSFLGCAKKECERYIRATDCRLELKISLEEQKCYKQCCGSSVFNEQQCDAYNQERGQVESSWQGVLIGVLLTSAFILLTIIVCFVIRKQKCFEREESVRKLSKYNIVWKPDYVQQVNCEICKKAGAALQTPCQHFFHTSCFEQKARQKYLPLCPVCQNQIRQRIKIGCMGCKERAFKVKLWKKQQLGQIVQSANALHQQICSFGAQSDDLLLSPAPIKETKN